MARAYLRPGTRKGDLELLLGKKRETIINPTIKEALAAVKKVERSCRKNLIDKELVVKGVEAVNIGFESVSETPVWDCPNSFSFGVDGTMAQTIYLKEGLIGFYAERQKVEPGRTSSPLVFDCRSTNPYKWLKMVLNVFWLHLTDAEIDELRQIAFENATLKNNAALEQMAVNERKRYIAAITKLCQGKLPEYLSELGLGAQRLLAALKSPDDTLSWSSVKKMEPSITSRYQAEFQAHLVDNKLDKASLEELQCHKEYSLRLSAWRKGLQVVKDAPQVVFEIQAEAILDEYAKRGGIHKTVVDQIKKSVAALRFHPGDAHTVGWLRVHVDTKNSLAFIDEVQSDMMEELHLMKKTNEAAKEIYKRLERWMFHGFASISSWANDMGYRVATHTWTSSLLIPGKTRSERKWNQNYKVLIDKYGFKETSCPGYKSLINIKDS